MMNKLRAGGVAATAMTVALIAAACGPTTTETVVTEPAAPVEVVEGAEAPEAPEAPAATGEPVQCTWWHNGTGEPLLSFWQGLADAYTAQHPNVTFQVQAFQNEEFDTVLPTAIAGGTAPDIFQSWGGTDLINYVNEGVVMDITEFVPPAMASAAEAYRVGDGIYGIPYTLLPSGFWVNMDLWEQAGLTEADFPTTLDELFERWATLQEAGIVPVAVGGVDGWPAAHWYYWAALREVPADVMEHALSTGDFSDPSWERAGELVQQIMDQNAFNPGWQATSAQQGAASASGMVVTGQAAMQLMGTWDYGVMGGLYNEAMGLPEDAQDHAEFLRWFPFPAVPGSAGDPTAIMGGLDGFSVSAGAPRECAEFLGFLANTENQSAYAAMGNIPIDAGATSAMPSGPLDDAAEAVANASSVQLWLDRVMRPADINQPIVAFMNGQGTPRQVADAFGEEFARVWGGE